MIFNPMLGKMKEAYSMNKTVEKILENQVKQMQFSEVQKCMSQILEETKTEAMITKQYLDLAS